MMGGTSSFAWYRLRAGQRSLSSHARTAIEATLTHTTRNIINSVELRAPRNRKNKNQERATSSGASRRARTRMLGGPGEKIKNEFVWIRRCWMNFLSNACIAVLGSDLNLLYGHLFHHMLFPYGFQSSRAHGYQDDSREVFAVHQ